ncbi:MAG: response regulator transcription factor [Luteolibacter sp.]|uniref:response regulator transcription factor n=1 Tax=Luteolibacter sp. TaxID=1962973 RepID=UPI003265CE4D
MTPHPEFLPETKSVFLVDDHPMVREQLTQLIDNQPDLHVCGEARDVSEALEGIERQLPDIAVVDLNLRKSSGLDLIKDLKARGLRIPILVLSMHDEGLYAERALRAGAMGYVSKQENTREILMAIRQVLGGGIHVSPGLAGKLVMNAIGGNLDQNSSPVSKLADRELEVFQLIGRGCGTRKIAESLGLSVKTIESYRARIKDKLNLEDGVQLLQRAVQWVESYDDGKST